MDLIDSPPSKPRVPRSTRGRRATQPVADRFWSKVDTSAGPDGCWPWTAARDRGGYGRFGIGQRPHQAHRVAYVLAGGEIAEGPVLRHSRRCVTKACCNPSHLTPGTQRENCADTVAMGRSLFGVRQARAKLTDDAVVAIRRRRAAGETAAAIAPDFGISLSLVYQVSDGRGWRHVGASR